MDFLLWLKLSIAILFALGIDNIFWVPWDRNWIKWQNRWKFDNEEIKFYKNWKKTFGYRFLYIVDFKIGDCVRRNDDRAVEGVLRG